MSKSPRTPKNTVKVRSGLPKVGDTIMIPVTITGTRPMKPSGSTVEYEMVTLRIPGHQTPVTVPAQYLRGNVEPDT